MNVHSGGRPVDPAVLQATRAALLEAREAVVVVTTAVHCGDLTAAADAVAAYFAPTCDRVQQAGRINALMSMLLHTAAGVIRDCVAAPPEAVISFVTPADAGEVRQTALRAISFAANADLPAAVDVLLAYARQCGDDSHPYAAVAVDLCLVTEQIITTAVKLRGRP